MRIIFFSLIAFMSLSFAQSTMDKVTNQLNSVIERTDSDEELLVWVFFKDKGNTAQQYLEKPTSVVSEKSLKRRSKVLSEDKLITETDLPVNLNYIEQVQTLGLKLKQKTKWFNGISGWATKQQIVNISNLQIVEELDIVHKFKKDYIIEEDDGSHQINQNNNNLNKVNSFNYGQSLTQLNVINVPPVHNLGYTGEGVTICMMDAGFDLLSHQVFSSMNIIATWDFVNGDANVENHGDMGNGAHGTSTLSLIGGFYEGELIGPAFGADFILAKTENTESETPVEEDNWIAALEWADSIGVDVTSTSLSYTDFDPPFQGYTWQDMDGNTARITIGADLAVKLGIFVVNSAGNYGYNPDHNTLGAPADGDSVIAVGSVTSGGGRSSFSSVGPSADGRIKPDLMAMGSNNYVACNWFTNCYSNNGSGTSWSCPMLAGAAALLLELDPSLTPMELRDVLRNTASRSTNPDNLYGWGIINTNAAVQSLLTSVDNQNVPENFVLLRNYPNPFNPSTKIQFSIPFQSNVKITLHDLLGREMKEMFNSEVEAGTHEMLLDGSELSSGVYLVRMITENIHKTIKISLLK
ncbi:MAG: S8 family peptidase [Ignavibacteria bacterium]|nr:S8 family peptidase [Ignavibacteria bacterium]MBT8392786.1 S8 family peptidase [Ignavibacteria bacterium]NNJ54347.1 S8 family serine peptidase [Ignavibacteriaceae bacterium]NNL20536.1 S8 family serine peptidase [Ignavibacteriaceae bacterium]